MRSEDSGVKLGSRVECATREQGPVVLQRKPRILPMEAEIRLGQTGFPSILLAEQRSRCIYPQMLLIL